VRSEGLDKLKKKLFTSNLKFKVTGLVDFLTMDNVQKPSDSDRYLKIFC
jgi:hypothetical protein